MRGTVEVEVTLVPLAMIEQKAIADIMTALEEIGREMTQDLMTSVSMDYPPASEPGDPPHRRSGDLQASFRTLALMDRLEIRMKSYGKLLEEGTSRMAARPFIVWVISGLQARTRWTKRLAKLVRSIRGDS